MLVVTQARTHCRCRKCSTRRVLPRHPNSYARLQPVCSGCGLRDWRADPWMNRRDTSVKGLGCNCPGYPWDGRSVHRKGSPFCWYRSDGTDRMPGDKDFKSVYDSKDAA